MDTAAKIQSNITSCRRTGLVMTPDVNVVYGEKHIFTVETPDGWINDKEFAQKIGLVCFFYAKEDSQVKQKSYIYANGIDKAVPEETMDGFIESDSSILVFSFSATTEDNYTKYRPVFDAFIQSFNYRGSNPQPFLDYMENVNQKQN